MQNILIASDLSIRSDRAIQRAVKIAADKNAHVTIIHVVDDAMPMPIALKIKTEAETALATFVTSCKPSVEFEVITVIDDPIAAILAAAARIHADLLVVGIHRDRHFLDQLKETTMERLIRTSNIPTLLVHDPADHPYQTVLSAVDMSRACAKAITMARDIATPKRHDLFHAYHIPYRGFTNPNDTAAATAPFLKEAKQEFDAWAGSFDLPGDIGKPEFIDAGPTIALQQMLDRTKPDLLTLGAHTRSNLGRFILGGFTAGLVRYPPCDLLVAK